MWQHCRAEQRSAGDNNTECRGAAYRNAEYRVGKYRNTAYRHTRGGNSAAGRTEKYSAPKSQFCGISAKDLGGHFEGAV